MATWLQETQRQPSWIQSQWPLGIQLNFFFNIKTQLSQIHKISIRSFLDCNLSSKRKWKLQGKFRLNNPNQCEDASSSSWGETVEMKILVTFLPRFQ